MEPGRLAIIPNESSEHTNIKKNRRGEGRVKSEDWESKGILS